MSNLLNFFNVFKCGKCLGKPKAMVYLAGCNHFFCKYCDNNLTPDGRSHKFICSICSLVSSRVTLFELLKAVNEQNIAVAKHTREKKDLKAALKTLKHEKWINETERRRKEQYECVECETRDCEQNMQLCSTCHGLKFKDCKDVKQYVLCSTCAIKKHIRQGHQTVEFFPYLSGLQFLDKWVEIKPTCEKLEKSYEILKDTSSKFDVLLNHVKKQCDTLADMARRTKSTERQFLAFEKMKSFIDRSKKVSENVTIDVKKHTDVLEGFLVEMKNWCDNQEGECYAESEIVNLSSIVPKACPCKF